MATDWQAVDKTAGRIQKLAANLARFGDTQHAADLRLLLSALAEAREDSKRLDWLEDSGLTLSVFDQDTPDWAEVFGWMIGPDLDGSNQHGSGKTARAAIDAARGGAP